jgi:uncharacterized repeat protein (TIGR01451 family)
VPSDNRRTAAVPRWLAASLALTMTALAVASLPATAEAAPAPAFDCVEPRFFAQAEEPIGTTQLYEGSYTASGGSAWSKLGPTVAGADLYNAIAFNPVDEHIYGTTYGVAGARGKFVRINRSGVVTNLGVSAPSMAAETYSTLWDSGEFDASGNYYVASGNAGNAAAGTIYKVSGLAASTGSAGTQPALTKLTLSPIPDYADFSFKDGYLWTHNYGNANVFYRIDTTTGAVDSYSSLGVLPIGNYGSVFTMTNGNLAFIDTASKMHQVAVTGSTTATPTFELVSTVSAPVNQRSDATNCATAQQASLSVTKTGPATVVMGEEIAWTVTVTNDGPGVSSGFVAIDTLPPGVTNAVATSSKSTCAPQGGLIVCNGGRLALNETVVITVKARAPMKVGSIVNTVRIVGNEDSTPSTSAPSTQVTLGTTAGGTDTAELDLGAGGAGASVTDGANGTVRNVDGNLVYIPVPGFSGVDSFTYTADGGSPVTVYVTVVPKAAPDAVTTSIDSHVSGDVRLNDSGINLQFSKRTNPTNGSVVVNADGTFTYTPNSGYVGSDSFTYTVTGDGGAAAGTVMVTILAGPVAAADAVTTPANTAAKDIDVIANDSGTALAARLLASPTNGTAVDNGDNTFTYTPSPGFSGSDQFSYTLSGSGGTATGTVTVTVTPVAVGDTLSTSANTAATLDVRLNDVGMNLTAALLSAAANGTVAVGGGGTATYTPGAGYSGPDSFTYTLTGDGGTATATVSVMVTPAAPDDSATTVSGQAVVTDVLANDLGSGLAITGVSSAASGVASIVPGGIRYQPNSGFSGIDTFSYTAEDASGNEVIATVTIVVSPVAVDDAITATASTPLTVQLVTNDSGSALKVTSATAPANGTVTVNADGSVTFTPHAGFSGYDTFHYTATDSSGNTATATVTITVTPSAAPESRQISTGGTVRISLLRHNVGSGLAVTSVTQPANGTVVLSQDGTATYTANPGFRGLDAFSYTVTDAAGLSVTSTVTIDVRLPALVQLAATGYTDHGLVPPAALLVLIGAALLAGRPSRAGRHSA